MLGFYDSESLLQKKINNSTPVYRINQTPLGICGAVLIASPHKVHTKFESFHRMTTRMIPSLHNKPYEERLTQLNLGWDSRVPKI